MHDLFAGRRIGVCLRDLPGSPTPADPGFDVVAAIASTAAIGATLLHLPGIGAAGASLDHSRLAAVGEAAASAGVALSASLPAVHPDRTADLWGEDPDAATHPTAQIRAAQSLGVQSLHVTVGQDDDRFRATPPWADQLERTVPVLQDLVSRADVPIVLKTHEEMTTWEALALCDAVPGLQLGFSPVNVVARLEDPLAASQRVAERVHTIFFDDCALVRRPTGLVRAMRSVTTGALPWDAMLALLPANAPLVVDLHRAELAMPVYDLEWLRYQPELSVVELAALYGRSESGSNADDALSARSRAALALLADPAPSR